MPVDFRPIGPWGPIAPTKKGSQRFGKKVVPGIGLKLPEVSLKFRQFATVRCLPFTNANH